MEDIRFKADGHKYATHIIDLETGHILWIVHGKKKQVVYDFIDHVGQEWMNGVEAKTYAILLQNSIP